MCRKMSMFVSLNFLIIVVVILANTWAKKK